MADILVFGAHPDDAEFGMGASIVKFVRSGASVAVCVLTRGEAGTFGTPVQREKEMRAAAAKAGCELEILSFHDCRIFDSYETRVRLAEVIRRVRPRIVFAPLPRQPHLAQGRRRPPRPHGHGHDRALGLPLRPVRGAEGRWRASRGTPSTCCTTWSRARSGRPW